MGWADRDYAKWTTEERERVYGSGAPGGGARSGNNAVFRRGIGPAILVSAALLALGHFPAGHPILPMHFSLPGSPGSQASAPPTGTIRTPGTAALGSTLTLHGTTPPGNRLVTVEGSIDGGRTWQTLSSVGSTDGSYEAQITLGQLGLLQIRTVFSDGSEAVGSIVVS